MFRGTIDAAAVYPREVVKEALRVNAAAVIFSHNHPSGNPEPSQADKVLTQRLKEALALVDVARWITSSWVARRQHHLRSRGCSDSRGFGPFCCALPAGRASLVAIAFALSQSLHARRCLSVRQGPDPMRRSPAEASVASLSLKPSSSGPPLRSLFSSMAAKSALKKSAGEWRVAAVAARVSGSVASSSAPLASLPSARTNLFHGGPVLPFELVANGVQALLNIGVKEVVILRCILNYVTDMVVSVTAETRCIVQVGAVAPAVGPVPRLSAQSAGWCRQVRPVDHEPWRSYLGPRRLRYWSKRAQGIPKCPRMQVQFGTSSP